MFYLLLVAAGFYAMLRLSFELFWRAVSIEILPANWRAEAFLYLIGLGIAVGLSFNGLVAGLFVFLALPFLLTFAYAGYSGLSTLRKVFSYVYTNLMVSYGNFLMVLLLAIPLMWLLDTAIGGLVFAFLDWVFYADVVMIDNINVILQGITYYFLFGIVFAMGAIAAAFNFYTLREIEEADSLLEDIEQFGAKRRIRGMELE